MISVIDIFVGILNVFGYFIIFYGWMADSLCLPVLIITNIISNYLTFGFKNINVHISNICIAFSYILYFIYMNYSSKVDNMYALIVPMMSILYILYIISSINLTKKESKFYLYVMYFFLAIDIPYMIFALYNSFAHVETSGFLFFYPALLRFILLINNTYIPYHYLDNKYLKYTIIFISLAYFAVETYQGVLFVLNPDP